MNTKLILNYLRSVLALMLGFLLSLLPMGSPRIPHSNRLRLVWADEFDGNSLDPAKWEGHFCGSGAANPAVRRGSYWTTDMATVKDGTLHIRTEYYPEGYNGNGKPGWYTCGIDTNDLFEQTYGYFEVRCILPKGVGLWSAFWMISDSMSFSSGYGEIEGSGADGSEIDIFESAYYETKYPNRVASTIHYDGYGEWHRSKTICEPFILNNDPYEEFNTYGFEWNENGYIFYVNGIETGRTDFGGVTQVPEHMILSVEVGGNGAVPAKDWTGGPLTEDCEVTDFIVDYVRAYQYK